MHPIKRVRKILVAAVLLSLSLCIVAQAAMPKSKNRAEIDQKYRWNFADIYPNWDAWEQGRQQMEQKMNEYAALKGTLAGGAQNVLKAFKLSDEMNMIAYKVYRYPQLQRDVNTKDNEVSAKLQQVQLMFAKFGTATAWFSPEMLAIPWETMQKWLDATPELATYRFPITDLYRQQEHILDEKGEQLLSYFGPANQAPQTAFTELSTSDIKFRTATFSDGKELLLTPGEYSQLLTNNRNQADRKLAFETMYGVYKDNENTYAAIYGGICQRDWALAQARNHATTLEAALDADNVPMSVYENLVKSVKTGSAPMQRYYRLRQEALGLSEYHLYDGSISVVDLEKTYDYDEVLPWVIESVAPLGKDYQDKLRKATSAGWIDVYENEGKRTGAYSAGVYGVHPFMLMNFNGTLDAVFTLAHELGHTLHTQLSHENQPFATSQYTIFVAEVASTLNEHLFLEYMLKRTPDPKERIKLLEQQIDNIVGTFYTQVMFADYERQAHKLVEEGQPITADVLSGLYRQIMIDYFGDSMIIDELYDLIWARIPHFYNSPYYVYQYATCFASSAKLVQGIQSKDEKVRKESLDRYLTLLKSGGNDYPMEQLKKAGVDLTQPEAIQAVVQQLDQLVSQYEQELKKLKT